MVDSELFSSKFQIHRADRNFVASGRSRGGGVLMAIDNRFSAVTVDLSSLSSAYPIIDFLCMQVRLGHFSALIFLVYIPPASSLSLYERLVEELVALHPIIASNIIILGDFNIPDFVHAANMSVSSSHLTSFSLINNLCNYFDLTQLNSALNNHNRLLDLVLSNVQDCSVVKSTDKLLAEDPLHPAIDIAVPLSAGHVRNSFTPNIVPSFNFKKANFNLLYELLLEADFDFLFNYSDIDLATHAFYEKINNILCLAVPMTAPRISKNYPPWFSADIIRSIRNKKTSWRKYKSSGCLIALAKFKELRGKIKYELTASYKNYIANAESKFLRDPKSFWSFISNKRHGSSIPSNMFLNDASLSEPQIIVNAFASFFQSSFTSSSSLDRSGINNPTINSNNLLIKSFSEAEVFLSLKKLKNKLTSGPDGLPSCILKDCASIFTAPLTYLFNLSLNKGKFPDVWKQSNICPVFKKGDRSNIENYRPIALLCNFSKVFESVLYTYIFNHVKSQISTCQHGFVAGRSTVTNLYSITQFLSERIDASSQVDVVYTDFSKAFDRLDHSLLCTKLERFGFTPNLVGFFANYLHNRKMRVKYRGFESVPFIATSGVPQGSILGPLLFLMFIDDITYNLNCQCLMYADDLKLFKEIRSVEDCADLQENLNLLHSWCLNNKLLLNISKCCVVSYSRKRLPLFHDYTLDNQVLLRLSHFTDLGVTFDSGLKFDEHICNIVSSAYKILGFVIRNSKDFNSIAVLIALFNSFVRSKLEYCCTIWNPNYLTYITEIEKILRRFLKFLSYKIDGVYPVRGIPQDFLLTRFNFTSLSKRRFYFSIAFLFKLLNGFYDCPQILDNIKFHVPSRQSRGSSCLLFYYDTPRTNALKYSPLHVAVSNYNQLHDRLDLFSMSISQIKRICLN